MNFDSSKRESIVFADGSFSYGKVNNVTEVTGRSHEVVEMPFSEFVATEAIRKCPGKKNVEKICNSGSTLIVVGVPKGWGDSSAYVVYNEKCGRYVRKWNEIPSGLRFEAITWRRYEVLYTGVYNNEDVVMVKLGAADDTRVWVAKKWVASMEGKELTFDKTPTPRLPATANELNPSCAVPDTVPMGISGSYPYASGPCSSSTSSPACGSGSCFSEFIPHQNISGNSGSANSVSFPSVYSSGTENANNSNTYFYYVLSTQLAQYLQYPQHLQYAQYPQHPQQQQMAYYTYATQYPAYGAQFYPAPQQMGAAQAPEQGQESSNQYAHMPQDGHPGNY